MQYEVIQNANDSWRLRIAVPGFKKDEIDPTFEQGWLTVKAKKAPSIKPWIGGIPTDLKDRFNLGEGTKIDMCTLQDGILEFLVSRNLEHNGTRITIQ